MMVIVWAFWKNVTDWWYARQYRKQQEKKDDDERCKRGEDEADGGGEPDTESSVDNVPRPSELESGELLPPTEVNSDGEDSSGSGKSNFISRLRKKD